MNRQYRSVISILFPPLEAPTWSKRMTIRWETHKVPEVLSTLTTHVFLITNHSAYKEQWQLHSVHRPVTWDWEFTELELVLHVRSLQQFFLLSLTIERKLQLMSSSSWWKLTILIVSFAIESSSNFHLNFDVWTAGLWVFLDQLAKGDIRGVVYFWSCANIWSKGSNVQ